jgi:DUF1365 family protein
MHRRFAPKPHHFSYRIFLFAIDLDELPALSRRLGLFSVDRANLYSFRDRDYLPTGEALHNGRGRVDDRTVARRDGAIIDPTPSLKTRVVAYLATRGVDLTGGRVLLVTLPRIFGYGFNPVSFYFCYDRQNAPVAALTEVTNTFREMKPYFLGPDTRPPAGDGAPASFRRRTPKDFYVSPYSDVDVAFDFNLRAPDDRLLVQIDDYAGPARTLTSTVAGERRELTNARLAWWTFKYPLLTLRVIALIHWHALRLWLKRLPWFAKAARAGDQRELYRPHGSIAQPAQTR